MTLEAQVLRDDALRAAPDGFELDIRLAWYRSLPLSCVERVAVTLDGRDVPEDAITLVVDGVTHPLAALAELSDTWWFVQDAATLVVHDADPPASGQRATVGLRLDMRIPYIVIGPGTALVQHTHVERELMAR